MTNKNKTVLMAIRVEAVWNGPASEKPRVFKSGQVYEVWGIRRARELGKALLGNFKACGDKVYIEFSRVNLPSAKGVICATPDEVRNLSRWF